jgi:hypothetical protein
MASVPPASQAGEPSLTAALYYHLAMPAKVPVHPDSNPELVEEALLKRLKLAAQRMKWVSASSSGDHWGKIERCLSVYKRTHAAGCLDKTILLSELRAMRHDDLFILYLRSQNAALLIYQSDK